MAYLDVDVDADVEDLAAVGFFSCSLPTPPIGHNHVHRNSFFLFTGGPSR